MSLFYLRYFFLFLFLSFFSLFFYNVLEREVMCWITWEEEREEKDLEFSKLDWYYWNILCGKYIWCFFLRMCYKLHIVFSTDRIDDLDIRVKQFFMNCRKAKPEWKEQQYKQIRDVRSTYKTISSALIMQIEWVSNENGLSHPIRRFG